MDVRTHVWQAVLDARRKPPEIGSEAPVGYGGGISTGSLIGVRLAAADPRIAAAISGGGFSVDDATIEAARQITVPIQFLSPGTAGPVSTTRSWPGT